MEDFKPKFTFPKIEYLFEGVLHEMKIRNKQVYNTVERLVKKAYPSSETKFEKKWEDFYLPMERDDELITIPFSIVKYEGDFYSYFRFLGRLKITKGEEEIGEGYSEMFEEALRFTPVLKTRGKEVVEETVPYDYRIGKIRGKYVMEEVMPEEEKVELLRSYEKYLERDLKISQIALKNYLDVAAICYRAVYDEAGELSPEEMYKKWADGRHGGMLDIEPSSEKEFMEWRRSGRHIGSHPFEIVFSGWRHGIHLLPPSKEKPYYSIRVTNHSYSRKYIEMVRALLENEIPFKAPDLRDVLDLLSGEKYWTVNDYDDLRFIYTPSEEYRKRYFEHIDWEDLKIVKFRENNS